MEELHNRTLCELNGELIDERNCTTQILDNEIANFPQVHVTHESLLRSTILMQETAQSAFIEHDDTFSQRLSSAWYGHGLNGLLTEINDSSTEEVSPFIRKLCHYLLVMVRWINGMQFTLYPHLKLANEDLISIFSENNDWLRCPIRYLAWHSRADKFALALRDDTIRIYYSNNALVPMLKHKLQHNISVMAWKPLSASTLAVGTQTVILIWTVEPGSLSARPSASAAQVLSFNGHNPITSLAWCPHGRDHLFAVSALNSALLVWNVSAKEHQVLQHITTSGGVSRITFSPDGSKVMAATPGASFRVFEAATWTNERWSKLAGRVQSSCWGRDGTFLLFSLFGDPRIYSITFPDSRFFDMPVIDGSKHASVAADLSPQHTDGDTPPLNYIHSIAIDPTGERLAVMFSSHDHRRNKIALFTVSSNPILTISQSGFISGEEDVSPCFITFKPNYSKGALLTICYSNGLVSYVPMFFQPITTNMKTENNTTLNVSLQQTRSMLNTSQSIWSSGP